MRADLLKMITPEMSARAAALLVLMSDYERMLKPTDGWGTRPRTLEGLQEYNPRITRRTLWGLIKDGWIEPDKNGWRVKVV